MIPTRGNILHLQFDPASGREMKGDHFCLVVSPKAFNQRFQLAWVCPISRGLAANARESGFLVALSGAGLRTDGQVHAHQIKALDWTARRAKFIEQVPAHIMNEVLQCLGSVIEE